MVLTTGIGCYNVQHKEATMPTVRLNAPLTFFTTCGKRVHAEEGTTLLVASTGRVVLAETITRAGGKVVKSGKHRPTTTTIGEITGIVSEK